MDLSKESIGFPDVELYDKSFEKYSLKNSNIPESRQTLKIICVSISSHLISFWFCQFLGTSGQLRKTKICWSEAEKLAVTGKNFFFRLSQKERFLKPIKKKILILLQLLMSRCQNYVYSTILVITKIYILLFLYIFFLIYIFLTSVLLLIMQSQLASIAWTVTSTAAFYHCWSYTEDSVLWIRFYWIYLILTKFMFAKYQNLFDF